MTKPAYLEAESKQRDRWMVSYVDVLTILLILFAASAANSSQKAAASGGQKMAAQGPAPVDRLEKIRDQLASHGLDVTTDSRGVVVSLPQAVLFAPGSDEVNQEAVPKVRAIAEVLRGIPNRVSVEGHADSVPIHNRRFHNNWELAAGRGLVLLELLSTRYGIAESRLSESSRGAFDPKSPNDTAEGRASNRRVEIVILDGAEN